MSRSGYIDDMDDQWAFIRWRGAVESSIRGKRGQAFLTDLRDALDAMDAKRLIAGVLEEAGEVCALGALGRAKGVDMSEIDPDDSATVSATFGIAEPLAQEIVFVNDDFHDATPEIRWARMRRWVAGNIWEIAPQPTEGEQT